MSDKLSFSKKITKNEKYLFDFSVCTLVTRLDEYNEMLQSFVNKGFTAENTEYLHIDNSVACTFDAYEGLNIFLQKAQGEYIILCHQDILIHDNNKTDLLKMIAEIEKKDANWAVLANAGGINLKWIATHITQGNGRIILEKDLPLKVKSVDENFIIIKKSANLSLSRDLNGFHFYGTDICIIADILGYSCYVIGFNITHKSNGKIDTGFYESQKNIKTKYLRAFRARFLSTTFSRIYFTGNKFGFYIFNSLFMLFLVRQYYKFFTKKSDYKL